VEFDQYSPQPEPTPDPPAERVWWPYAVGLLVLVLGVAAYLLLRSGPPPPPPELTATAPAATEEPAEAAAKPTLELPALVDSDDWLRRVAAGLSAHPELARWLVTDNLVRRFTAAVDNVARGESPRPHLGFLAPVGGFATVERGGGLFADPDSHRRYDRVAEVIDSVDADGAAELYRRLEPLLQEGYADLGYPDRKFDDALGQALRHLLATPMTGGEPRLEPGVESYVYRDVRFEGLSPAQKHLLRTGPDNAAVILDKLRQIGDRLGLTEG
jgi:hypothetical protein